MPKLTNKHLDLLRLFRRYKMNLDIYLENFFYKQKVFTIDIKSLIESDYFKN